MLYLVLWKLLKMLTLQNKSTKDIVVCVDEGGTFSMGNINNRRNVLIFGVDESSLVHSNNKANNVYVMSDRIVQGINDTTLYAKKHTAKILLKQVKNLY